MNNMFLGDRIKGSRKFTQHFFMGKFKKLILCPLILSLAACGGGDEVQQVPEGWVDFTPPWNIRSNHLNPKVGGLVEEFSWGFYFTSPVTNSCKIWTSWECNRGDLHYRYGRATTGDVTNYSFILRVDQYDFTTNPWVILMQDWTRVYPQDSNGNRPITELTLDSDDRGTLYLRHDDVSDQFYLPMDDPKYKRVTHGKTKIEIGVEYLINLEITDGLSADTGRARLTVNGVEITDSVYQTKGKNYSSNDITLGVYHVYGYNPDLDPTRQIRLSISDIKFKKKRVKNNP